MRLIGFDDSCVIKRNLGVNGYDEPILEETYGIMVYQEQVMKIAQVLGGYTMGGADKLRKVMGKKMRDEIPKQRIMFTEGAIKNGIDEEVAKSIVDNWCCIS